MQLFLVDADAFAEVNGVNAEVGAAVDGEVAGTVMMLLLLQQRWFSLQPNSCDCFSCRYHGVVIAVAAAKLLLLQQHWQSCCCYYFVGVTAVTAAAAAVMLLSVVVTAVAAATVLMLLLPRRCYC